MQNDIYTTQPTDPNPQEPEPIEETPQVLSPSSSNREYSESDLWNDTGIFCPHCQYYQQEHEYPQMKTIDSQLIEWDCVNCGNPISVQVHVGRSYQVLIEEAA
ncbi:MAG TPA: hypothetical protein VH186_32860 [Chloroflexia bacterium]|nr:hypothetical protein [Chloroflexia bacterium]